MLNWLMMYDFYEDLSYTILLWRQQKTLNIYIYVNSRTIITGQLIRGVTPTTSDAGVRNLHTSYICCKKCKVRFICNKNNANLIVKEKTLPSRIYKVQNVRIKVRCESYHFFFLSLLDPWPRTMATHNFAKLALID